MDRPKPVKAAFSIFTHDIEQTIPTSSQNKNFVVFFSSISFVKPILRNSDCFSSCLALAAHLLPLPFDRHIFHISISNCELFHQDRWFGYENENKKAPLTFSICMAFNVASSRLKICFKAHILFFWFFYFQYFA